jgi:hypothetical protein
VSAQRRGLVFWLAVAGSAILVCLGCVGFVVWRFVISPASSDPRPAALDKPQVAVGGDHLQKKTMWQEDYFGNVTALQAQPTGVIVAGEGGARFLDAGNHVSRQFFWVSHSRPAPWVSPLLDKLFPGSFGRIAHSSPGTKAKIVGMQDGRPGFLVILGPVADEIALVDEEGNRRWEYEPDRAKGMFVDDAAAGDLAGDGNVAVAVGYGGGTGIRLFDRLGNELWHKSDGNVWHIEMIVDGSTGKRYLVHSNARGELVVRDSAGSVVQSAQPASDYLSNFSISTWQDGKQQMLVACGDDAAYIMRPNGDAAATYPLHYCSQLWDAHAVPVKLDGKNASFAILATHVLWKRSLLYIYNAAGKVEYQELLGEECQALATAARADHETLLLGCQGRVWQYETAR